MAGLGGPTVGRLRGATGEIALGRGLALGHHDDRGGAAAEQRAGLLVRDLPHARCARRPRRMATPSADPECLPTFCNQIACSSSCCSPTATLVARRCRCLAHISLCVRARAPLLVSSLYVYAVSTHEQLVSKSFQGRHGRAFLFTTATNVMLGPKEERILMTGLHSVADIYCTECSSRLGWKYLEAFESRHDAPASHIMMTPRDASRIASHHLYLSVHGHREHIRARPSPVLCMARLTRSPPPPTPLPLPHPRCTAKNTRKGSS